MDHVAATTAAAPSTDVVTSHSPTKRAADEYTLGTDTTLPYRHADVARYVPHERQESNNTAAYTSSLGSAGASPVVGTQQQQHQGWGRTLSARRSVNTRRDGGGGAGGELGLVDFYRTSGAGLGTGATDGGGGGVGTGTRGGTVGHGSRPGTHRSIDAGSMMRMTAFVDLDDDDDDDEDAPQDLDQGNGVGLDASRPGTSGASGMQRQEQGHAQSQAQNRAPVIVVQYEGSDDEDDEMHDKAPLGQRYPRDNGARLDAYGAKNGHDAQVPVGPARGGRVTHVADLLGGSEGH